MGIGLVSLMATDTVGYQLRASIQATKSSPYYGCNLKFGILFDARVHLRVSVAGI